MFDFQYLLTGNRKNPAILNLRGERNAQLYFDSLARGLFIGGRPGSGKTYYAAYLLVQYMEFYPDRGGVIVDASGTLCSTVIAIILALPSERRDKLLARLVYDEPGRSDYTHTLPEFSQEYGPKMEAQVERVAMNLQQLNQDLVERNPTMGGNALKDMAPQVFRLLSSILTEYGDNWQITEAKKILLDGSQRYIALNRFGGRTPTAKYYFEQIFNEWPKGEQAKLTYGLTSALGVIEPEEIRARLGYYRPTWTLKKANDENLMVLVNGERYLNFEPQMNYLTVQIHSLVRQYANTRTSDDPNNKPFLYWIDEAPMMSKVPGMAEQLAEISTFYRSRKICVGIFIQKLSQLTEKLQHDIWSVGNIVCFGLDDYNDALEFAKQLFNYSPTMVKQEAKTHMQNNTTEPVTGQDRQNADWIQSFPARNYVMRRYYDQTKFDKYIRYSKSPTVKKIDDWAEIQRTKLYLLRDGPNRGVEVRRALEVTNHRSLQPASNKTEPVQIK